MAGISEAFPVIIISSDIILDRTASHRQALDHEHLHRVALAAAECTAVAEEEDVRESLAFQARPFRR